MSIIPESTDTTEWGDHKNRDNKIVEVLSGPEVSEVHVHRGTAAKRKHSFSVLTKPIAIGLTAFLLILISVTVGNHFVTGLLIRLDSAKKVHVDQSDFGTPLTSQVLPLLRIAYQNQDGKTVQVLVNEEEYTEFVRVNFNVVRAARDQAIANIPTYVSESLAEVREDAVGRVSTYADWYFSWGTGYTIIFEAAKSFANHALAVEPMYLKDAVANDVGAYILKHYEELVLYPEVSDHKVGQAFESAYQQAHADYMKVFAELDRNFQEFVQNKTSHANSNHDARFTTTIDWSSQIEKLNLSLHNRGSFIEAAKGLAFTAGSAAIGGKIASGATGKLASSAGAKLALKSAGPFVSKAMVLCGAALAGAPAGPIGIGVGFAAGVAADYLVNKGVELGTRSSFEDDVKVAVDATFDEWGVGMSSAIQQNATIWFDDTLHLLGGYSQK